jgi:membrane associated rhomboid family serine protease
MATAAASSARTARRTVGTGAIRAVKAARATPFATVAVAALIVTALVLRLAVDDDDHVFAWVSTNVANLTHRPIAALVASAFVLTSGPVLPWALALAAVLIPMERRYGTKRTIAVFAAGHIVATALTEIPVGIGIHYGWLPMSDAHIIDVGVSYGFAASLVVALGLVPAKWRHTGMAIVLAYVLFSVTDDFGVTSSGHLIAVLIGLGASRLLQRGAQHRKLPQLDSMTPGLQAAVAEPDVPAHFV